MQVDSTTPRPLGRPRQFDMDTVLDAAVRVFRARGYNGTSIADLRRAMHLTAGSLYKAFADKRAIFVAALDHYIADSEVTLTRRVQAASNGREKVLATLQTYAAASCGEEGRLGCMVVGGLTDADTFDAALKARFDKALARIEKGFARYLEEGIGDGSLNRQLDVAATAAYLTCVVEGMRVLGKRGAKARRVEAIVQQTMRAVQ